MSPALVLFRDSWTQTGSVTFTPTQELQKLNVSEFKKQQSSLCFYTGGRAGLHPSRFSQPLLNMFIFAGAGLDWRKALYFPVGFKQIL